VRSTARGGSRSLCMGAWTMRLKDELGRLWERRKERSRTRARSEIVVRDGRVAMKEGRPVVRGRLGDSYEDYPDKEGDRNFWHGPLSP
jgi:hypothetical protein